MSNTTKVHIEIQDSLRSRHKVSLRAKEIPIRRFGSGSGYVKRQGDTLWGPHGMVVVLYNTRWSGLRRVVVISLVIVFDNKKMSFGGYGNYLDG